MRTHTQLHIVLLLFGSFFFISMSGFAQTLPGTRETEQKLQIATEKAQQYFRTLNNEEIDPVVYLLLNYIEKQYALDFAIDYSKPIAKLDSKADDDETYRYFNRLRKPVKKAPDKKFMDLQDEQEKLGIRALHCDLLKEKPEKLLNDISALYVDDSYELTHALIWYGFAVDVGCIDRSSPAAQAFEKDAEKKLRELIPSFIADMDNDIDIYLESVCTLYYLDLPYKPRKDELAMLLNRQRSDGGWARADNPSSDQHPSVFGLWMLLEQLYPEKQHTSWVIK